MPDLIPYSETDFIWPKGSTYFGEPLPYLVTATDGKRMVAYGDWWTPKRIGELSEWLATAQTELLMILGNDHTLAVRGRARVMREASEAAGKGSKTTFAEFASWTPDPVQRLRIDALTKEWAEAREWVRSSLSEAARLSSETIPELSGPADGWGTPELAAAAMRFPKILMRLVAIAELTNPVTIIPAHALA